MLDLRDVMKKDRFAVVGNTLAPEKYAYKIKEELLAAGYTVHGVGYELETLDQVPGELEVVDLCIRPERGLALLHACRKPIGCVVIQPGAGSDEIRELLTRRGIPFLDGCLLVGLRLYPRKASPTDKKSRMRTGLHLGPGFPQEKEKAPVWVLFLWRRWRDSNPRADFSTYALSRGASSPT